MNSHRASLTGFLCLLALVLMPTGCSRRPKNVAPVKGKVTLAGQPLAGATVVFSPTSEGSSSRARTNANGEFELQYSKNVKGAQIGEHSVFVTTKQAANPSAKPPIADQPEKVPFKYRTGPDQPKVTVKAGANSIDVTLEPGPIDPPQPKGKKKGK